MQRAIDFEEPRLARWLFAAPAAGWIWLVPRLYFGWEWFHAGWEKVFGTSGPSFLRGDGASWLSDGGAQLKGFAGFALQGAAQGPHSAVNYGWYASFLRWVGDSGAPFMAKIIAIGELAIGIALIVGLFTGISGFFAGALTMSFGLAGVAGVNPAFFLFEVLFILAWRNAGFVGLDRYVLPSLGTPWHPGKAFAKEHTPTGHAVA